MYTVGILKNDVVNNGITYKAGSKASFPVQYGLEEYFESYVTSESEFGESITSTKKSSGKIAEEEI